MKLRYALATLAAVAVAVPTLASAETVIIKKRDHDHFWRGARAEFVEHRRFHRDFDRDHGRRVVIIKHRHHHDWD